MAISYSALNNYGRATLPSVDTWGTNMNILRDPPKSVHTRRIDKVGETSDITQMQQESGNRSCEAIQVFARGVNPFVSVSYSNEGNNGGMRSGGLTAGGQTAAYLPYRVARDGAFRPPTLPPEYLIPQSRQPRVWTTAFSNPEFPDYSKKMRTCGTDKDFREVKTETLKACVRPTATFRVDKPLTEPFEVKTMVKDILHTQADSGIRTMDRTTQHVLIPTKETFETPLHAFAQANVSEDRYVNTSQKQTDQYIQSTNAHSATTNISSNRQVTAITDLLDLSDMPIKDIRTTDYTAPISGYEQNNLTHEPIDLARNLPTHFAATNRGQNIHKAIQHENELQFQRNTPMTSWEANPVAQGASDHGSRTVTLAPKIQPGGYDVPGQIPMTERMQNVREMRDTPKTELGRSVMEQFQSRWP